MEITVEMAAKTSREYNGRVKWGVHPKGAPKDYWVDIYVQDRPKPGQVFNLGAIKEEKSKDGAKTFREAEIIGPAAVPQAQPEPQPQGAITPTVTGNGNAWPAPETKPTGQPGASYGGLKVYPDQSGKIKWDDWVQIAVAASELAHRIEPDFDPPDSVQGYLNATTARVAFVNTTLIAFSNGKLELPTEAGPASREPGSDDDPYANPNDALPPWVNG